MNPLSLLVTLLAVGSTATAQSERRVMVAGQLAVTAEPDLDGNPTLSVNTLPLVVEWAATDRVGLRANSLLNLQVVGPETGLAHRGAGLTVPVYLSGKRDLAPQQCFYLGPHATLAANPLAGGSDLTLAGEGGVRWLLGDRGALNLTAQLGATRIDRPADTRWVDHFGFFPSIGVWL